MHDDELNRVLGGGLVSRLSGFLIGGEPGIGKIDARHADCLAYAGQEEFSMYPVKKAHDS